MEDVHALVLFKYLVQHIALFGAHDPVTQSRIPPYLEMKVAFEPHRAVSTALKLVLKSNTGNSLESIKRFEELALKAPDAFRRGSECHVDGSSTELASTNQPFLQPVRVRLLQRNRKLCLLQF